VNVPFLDLARGVSSLRNELDEAIAGVLDRGRFVLGERVAELESAFASYCGAGEAIGVASGTDAIAIALRAAGVEPGDEVIVPANTCVPTIAGVETAGATVVLADVDPKTWTLDPAAAAAAVTERTRAVIPVHLYGLCADVEGLRGLGLAIVEDAAQAHGAGVNTRLAGTLGDVAAFSFYPTKNLGALGDGGAVVTNDSRIAAAARSLRTYGERERYNSVRNGWNSRLDEMQAAILLVKLRRLEEWNERRRAIAERYDEISLDRQFVPAGFVHAYHLYVVRSPERNALRRRLAEQGIETLVHYPRAVHQHPAYARLARPGLDVSEHLASEVLSLPLYPELTEAEVEAVVEALAG
jgi:dTDP-3-amino-3,4,6-trideoxy-alpha-D-glucose transaminase